MFVDSQHSLPVEALNLIVESKPLPVEVNNSTIELHLPVEAKEKRAIVESKPLPVALAVEVNNLTIELYLFVDSQYSSPVEALNLIVESKPLPVEVNKSTIELHLPVKVNEKRAIVESKLSPVEVNNSITDFHLPVEACNHRFKSQNLHPLR